MLDFLYLVLSFEREFLVILDDRVEAILLVISLMD